MVCTVVQTNETRVGSSSMSSIFKFLVYVSNLIFYLKHREQHTLQLLSKFKDKLEKVKEKEEETNEAGQSSKPTFRIKAVNDNNDDDIVGGKRRKLLIFCDNRIEFSIFQTIGYHILCNLNKVQLLYWLRTLQLNKTIGMTFMIQEIH